MSDNPNSERPRGTLSVVSVPIGNPQDITLRAIDTIGNCDIVLCEDLKPARALLHHLQLTKELLPLNEHTTRHTTEEALTLLGEGKSLVLISDAGTPLLADPGFQLVERTIQLGYTITTCPGPSSILPALVLSGFSSEPFTFVGFLPKDKKERLAYAKSFALRRETLIFLEAPYRLQHLLDAAVLAFGGKRRAALALELTTKLERVHRANLLVLQEYYEAHPFKGEFVLVVEGVRKEQPKISSG